MEKKITVLFGINDFLVGGAQKLIADLFQVMDRSKYDLHLVTFFEFDERKNFYDLLPIDVVVHRLSFRSVYDVSGWISLFSLLKKIKPKVVISHIFFSNFVLRMSSLWFRYKISIVEHNTHISKSKLHILIDRYLSIFTHLIIAVSNTVSLFTQKQEHLPASKFAVIHNGIDLSVVDGLAQKYSNLNKSDLGFGGARVFINVGRLTAQKNQVFLVSAFAAFVKRHPNENLKLLILGEGSLRGLLEAKIDELGLQDKILLLGIKDPFPYFFVSDAFVSTSIIEGLSIAYIEALACGVPLVATKTAGTDELIVNGYNGFFVEPPVEAAFVDALDKVMTSSRKALAAQAKISAQKFSIIETAKAYERLIEDMALSS